MSKSNDEPVRFVAIGGHSPWGTSRQVLPDGTYLCEDASGGWYLDPVTGETDVAAMRGGTQWFGEKYRRRYVEGQLRDGIPWSEWDSRGQREWVANAVEHGWARPDGAPSAREENKREPAQAKSAFTGGEE